MTRVVLRHGDAEITVAPGAGGRVGSVVLAGAERLVTAPPTDLPPDDARMRWGVYPMVPWAGRIAGARFTWEGRTYDVPAMAGHGLHGVGHDVAWTVDDRTDVRVVMTCDLGAAGWPLGGAARHVVEIGSGFLRFGLTVTAGGRSMPAWCGWHPCFARPVTGDMALRVDAAGVLVTEDMIPTGEVRGTDGDRDLGEGPLLGGRRLDDCYVGPSSPATLSWPDLRLDVAFGDRTNALVVFTPSGSVCVEPQTGWPDALRLAQAGVSGTGVTRLAPGRSTSADMWWAWRPGGGR